MLTDHSARLKICIYAPVSQTGPGILFTELSSVLHLLGHDVTIVTHTEVREKLPLGDSVQVIKCHSILAYLNFLLSLLLRKYDVFITHFISFPPLHLYITSVLGGLPYLPVICGSDWFESLRPSLVKKGIIGRILVGYTNLRWRLVLKWSSLIVVTCRSIEKALLDDYGVNSEKISWICSTSDFDSFDPGYRPYALNIPKDKRVIAFVGRLSEENGIEYLVQSMKFILQERTDAHLVVAGSGKLETRLKTLAKDLGIDRHVTFCGFLSHELVPSFLANADIVVNPRIWGAGMGFSSLEAMAMAKPLVIGLANDTIAWDMKTWKCAVVVNPQEIDSMARAITDLLDNPEYLKEIGQRGREYVMRECSREKIAEDWKRFLDEALKDK